MKENGCLTKAQCAKIRRKAKKMGAEATLNSGGRFNSIEFKHLCVWFKFNPIEFDVFLSSRSFSDKEKLEEAKKEMDLAMEFKEFLKEINKEIETRKE